MTKLPFFLAGITLLLLQACTLSVKQEEHLNNQLAKYVASYNDSRLLELIGLTHPVVVKYYHAQGDSIMIGHFKNEQDSDLTYFRNPVYREMKEKGKILQRKYTVEYFSEKIELNHEYCIFALSDDGGNNWFFVREEDYKDKNIRGFKRLFN